MQDRILYRRFESFCRLQGRFIIAMKGAVKDGNFSIYDMDQTILDDLIDFEPDFARSVRRCRGTADAIAETIKAHGGIPDVPAHQEEVKSVFTSSVLNIADRPLSDTEAQYNGLMELQRKHGLMLALHVSAELVHLGREIGIAVPNIQDHAEGYLKAIPSEGQAANLLFEAKTALIGRTLAEDEDILLFLQDNHIPPEKYVEMPQLFERHIKMVEQNFKRAMGLTLANSPPVIIEDMGPGSFGGAISLNGQTLFGIFEAEKTDTLRQSPYSIKISPLALEKGPSFAYLVLSHELIHVMDFQIMHGLARHDLGIEQRASHKPILNQYMKYARSYYECDEELRHLQERYGAFLPYELFPMERKVHEQHGHIEKFIKRYADEYRDDVLRCPVNTAVNRVALAAMSVFSAPLPRI